jgi:indole-3-glycerol phosphate synthase
MSDILTQIVETTRHSLEREAPQFEDFLDQARRVVAAKEPHSFRRALAGGLPEHEDVLSTPYRENDRPPRIIAEVKCASPSAGVIVEDPAVEEITGAYQRGGAAALSVVTEEAFFKGDRSWLARASGATGLPVIMKDFIVEPVQIARGVAAGADAILLLAALLDRARMQEFITILDDLQRDALVEVHDDRELDIALEAGARMIGVNNRDLRDFSVTLETSERLVQRIPANVIRVSESGIRTRRDVDRLLGAGFDAFLVGESLLRQDDREAAVRELVG